MNTNNFSSLAGLGSLGVLAPLAVSLGMGLAATSCVGDEFKVGSAQDPDAGLDGGTGGDGGTDGGGGGLVLGTQFIPSPSKPSLGMKLPPTRAYLLWAPPSAVPDGKTIDHYDVCWTTGTVLDLGDESQCPNHAAVAATRHVIDSLKAGSQYFWKARASYTDGWTSYFSSAQPFLTDNSLVGWWRMDEGAGTTAADSSGMGNNGTLMNSPAWVPGFIGQGLQFGGTRLVSVADAPSLNFGTGDFSYSAWVMTSFMGAQAIMNKGTTQTSLYTDNMGKLSFVNMGCGIVGSGGLVTDGAWHDVMVQRKAGTVNLYMDGTMVGTGSCGDNLTNATAMAIGGLAGTALPFNGTIDDAMATNSAASLAAIQNQYCAAIAQHGDDPLTVPACTP